jgi:hypothetical protein
MTPQKALTEKQSARTICHFMPAAAGRLCGNPMQFR